MFRSVVAIAAVALIALTQSVAAVDRSKFKTCDKSAFCKRNRALNDKSNFVPQNYELEVDSITVQPNDQNTLTAEIRNGFHPLQDRLQLTVQILQSDIARVSIREKSPLHPRWEVPDVTLPAALKPVAASVVSVQKSPDGVVTIKVRTSPLALPLIHF